MIWKQLILPHYKKGVHIFHLTTVHRLIYI